MIYKNIILDIGNSRTKANIDGVYSYFNYSDNYVEDFEKSIINEKPNHRIIYSSVNKKVELELLNVCHINQIPAINARELIAVQDYIDISQVKGAGCDRILGLIGAWERDLDSFATIDFGSATTINFVQKRKFIGGAIMPGGITMLKSLGEISNKLKFEELIDWEVVIANNTQNALNSGIFLATVGGVEYALNSAKQIDMTLTENIFLTGGLSSIFYKKLNNNFNYKLRPNLVINGIEKLINGYL